MRHPPENKAFARLKTLHKESHNTQTPPSLSLEEKIAALVKALARQAAQDDHRAARETKTDGY